MTRKQGLLFGTKLLISAALLWAVLTKVELGDIVDRLKTADIRWLVPAMCIGPIGVILSAWRWQTLSLGLLTFGEAVRYTWIGLFFGTIMPGMVGGDVAKGVSLAAKRAEARDARLPVSIVVDKLVGFWVLMLLFNTVALWLLITQPDLLAGVRRALWITGGVTAAGLAGALALYHPRGAPCLEKLASRLPLAPLRNVVGRVIAALASYGGHRRLLGKAALISVAIHSLNAFSFWLVMHSLAIPASIGFAAVFYPSLSALLALPVSISGVGVRDVFAASMFTAFGLNADAGVAFSWLLLGLGIPNALVGGAIQLWEIFKRRSAG